jgi:hypothetical protein
MAHDRAVRPVESGAQLLRLIRDSLQRLQQKLHGRTPAIVDLWDRDRPKDENALSDYVKRHLEEDLRSFGVIAHREAEVRRGQETDIFVDAIAKDRWTDRLQRLSAIIEVKGCWHRDLQTALIDQLKGRYLREHPVGYGLYLVGWFHCEIWADEHRKTATPRWTLDEARQIFAEQATRASDEIVTIQSFVLDLALRQP